MPINTDALKDSIEGKPRRKSQGQADRHTSFAHNAAQQAEEDQRQLANTQKTKLDRLSSALDRAEQRRNEALEVLSDRLAYINDDRIFLKDLLELTKQKTAALSQAEDCEGDEEILEAAVADLTRGFESAWTWEYPALPEAVGFAR
jgi:hypothetical protein